MLRKKRRGRRGRKIKRKRKGTETGGRRETNFGFRNPHHVLQDLALGKMGRKRPIRGKVSSSAKEEGKTPARSLGFVREGSLPLP